MALSVREEEEAALRLLWQALAFADWAAGEGITTSDPNVPEPADFISDFIEEVGGTHEEFLAEIKKLRDTFPPKP